MTFLVEVRLRVEASADVNWIRQSLEAARRRVNVSRCDLRILSAVHAHEDGRLSCVIEATDREDVKRFFEIALLPSARVADVQRI